MSRSVYVSIYLSFQFWRCFVFVTICYNVMMLLLIAGCTRIKKKKFLTLSSNSICQDSFTFLWHRVPATFSILWIHYDVHGVHSASWHLFLMDSLSRKHFTVTNGIVVNKHTSLHTTSTIIKSCGLITSSSFIFLWSPKTKQLTMHYYTTHSIITSSANCPPPPPQFTKIFPPQPQPLLTVLVSKTHNGENTTGIHSINCSFTSTHCLSL